jgi:hypothetical protein
MNDDLPVSDEDVWPQFTYEAIKPDGWRVKGVPKTYACYGWKTVQRILGRQLFQNLTETWAEQLTEGPSRNDPRDPTASTS